MEEEWKDIDGFERKYQVSNTGKVRSLYYYGHGKIHELAQGHGDCRYCQVGLVKDGKVYTRRVHRLVAEAFINNPDGKPYIDHIDGNPLNNVVANLRWVSPIENSRNPNTRDRASGSRAVLRENKRDKNMIIRLERMRMSHRNIIDPEYEIYYDGIFDRYIVSASGSISNGTEYYFDTSGNKPEEFYSSTYLQGDGMDYAMLWADIKHYLQDVLKDGFR